MGAIASMIALELPASLGVHGPGETTILSGAIVRTPSASMASFLTTSISGSISPKYCTKL